MSPAVVAIQVAALTFYAVFIARSSFPTQGGRGFTLADDAMISMTYARNLADGEGLRWVQEGPPIEGYTNFLWTIVMTGFHLLGRADTTTPLLVMLVGAALLLGSSSLALALARRLSERELVHLAAVAGTALAYPLVFWTLRGMEVGVIAFLVLASLLLALRLEESARRADLALLVAAAGGLILTRTDTAAFVVVVVGYLAMGRSPASRRASLVVGVCALLLLALHTVFRVGYYGDALPNTYHLKVDGHSVEQRLDRGAATLLHSIGGQLWIIAAFVGALLATRFRTLSREVWLLLAIVGVAMAYSVYVGGDAWEWAGFANRYVAVVLPVLAILAALGAEAIVEARARQLLVASVPFLAMAGVFLWHRSTDPRDDVLAVVEVGVAIAIPVAAIGLAFVCRGSQKRGLLAGAAMCGCMLGLVLANARPVQDWVTEGGLHIRDDASTAQLGIGLRQATDPNAVLAVVWAGAVPYFSHRRTVDLLGKSDRVVARLRPRAAFLPGHDKWDYQYSVGTLRPDIIVELWKPTAVDLRDLRTWGYRRLRWMWVREGVAVDPNLLPRKDPRAGSNNGVS